MWTNGSGVCGLRIFCHVGLFLRVHLEGGEAGATAIRLLNRTGPKTTLKYLFINPQRLKRERERGRGRGSSPYTIALAKKRKKEERHPKPHM